MKPDGSDDRPPLRCDGNGDSQCMGGGAVLTRGRLLHSGVGSARSLTPVGTPILVVHLVQNIGTESIDSGDIGSPAEEEGESRLRRRRREGREVRGSVVTSAIAEKVVEKF